MSVSLDLKGRPADGTHIGSHSDQNRRKALFIRYRHVTRYVADEGRLKIVRLRVLRVYELFATDEHACALLDCAVDQLFKTSQACACDHTSDIPAWLELFDPLLHRVEEGVVDCLVDDVAFRGDASLTGPSAATMPLV